MRDKHAIMAQARKRPIVEEQQEKRERHEHRFRQQAEHERRDERKIPQCSGSSHIPQIPSHSQYPKKGRQDIFTFGDPRHRLDMQRVNGEQGCHTCAAPKRSGHPVQEEEEQ